MRGALSEELRNELAQIAPERPCDRLAELSALFHGAGSEHFRGRGEVAVHLDLGSAAGARRAFSLLRSFGVPCEVRTYRQRAFERAPRFQLHVPGDPRALQRASYAAAYAKGAETVEAVLALAGASTTVLALEERAVMATTRAQANRLANADHANLVRTGRAAHAQLEAIRILRQRGELERLDAAVQEAAGLRERYPTLPLSELAQRSGVPKPTLARRLGRLLAAAGEEKAGPERSPEDEILSALPDSGPRRGRGQYPAPRELA